jgi:hypothetical protein
MSLIVEHFDCCFSMSALRGTCNISLDDCGCLILKSMYGSYGFPMNDAGTNTTKHTRNIWANISGLDLLYSLFSGKKISGIITQSLCTDWHDELIILLKHVIK